MDGKPLRRYTRTPWGEVAASDLEPQGEPETVIVYRREEHLGLVVRGTFGVTLGMLGVRCERHGSILSPIGLAIADTPIAIDTGTLQSNPRRNEEPNEWR